MNLNTEVLYECRSFLEALTVEKKLKGDYLSEAEKLLTRVNNALPGGL